MELHSICLGKMERKTKLTQIFNQTVKGKWEGSNGIIAMFYKKVKGKWRREDPNCKKKKKMKGNRKGNNGDISLFKDRKAKGK